jgi:hypothetical protein
MKTFIFAILFVLFGLGAITSLIAFDLIGCALCGLIAYVCHKVAF